MALENGGTSDSVKVQFTTREGIYKQMHLAENFYAKKLQYSQGPASSATPVRTSFVRVNHRNEEQDCVCLTIGRELFYFLHKAIQEASQPLEFLDKRTYRGVAPTCHDINQHSASADSVRVAVGFTAGQVQIIDVRSKESLYIMNEDRSVEKSRVTCVKWYPGSDCLLLTSHINGLMYTYDVSQTCTNFTLQYQSEPFKSGDDYEILIPKTKQQSATSNASTSEVSSNSSGTGGANRNPVYKWIVCRRRSAVNSFKFSPCSRFVAVVTQGGYLRIFDHRDFTSHGRMKSYFGGLTAVAWSPDGRFLATGGEDDLVTVWSFCDRCVVARGTGHSSWIADIEFDAFRCEIPSDADCRAYYGLATASDAAAEHRNGVDALCNGDAIATGTAQLQRLRTYSNVSKLSRVSLQLDSNHVLPTLTYRFGSVGQDSLLCLWELDEHILSCARDKRTTQRSSEKPAAAAAAAVDNDESSTASSDKDESQPTRSVSNPHLLATTKDESKTKKLGSGGSNGWATIGKFATIGAQVRRKATEKRESSEASKEHKRNSSLPHFGFRASLSQNGVSGKYGFSKKHGADPPPRKPSVTTAQFGTELCPRLDQTTILEPLVCKKVSHGRMTGIDFMDDGIVTTCQDGYIQLWRRPPLHKIGESPMTPDCSDAAVTTTTETPRALGSGTVV